MKKKTVSVFLCICLLVSCLPISAAAADNILYPNVSNPYDVTFSDLNGQQYSTAADGRYKILVFGRPECGNTASVMYGLGKANACDYADVYMLRVDNQGESLPAFAAESGKCVGAKYFDYESAISYLSWDYFNQFIGSKTFTLPLVIVLDSSDTVVMASTAASGVVNGIKSVIGISDTEQPQTPDTTIREVTIPSSPEYSDEEWEVFRLTNKLRVSLGLNPLTMAPLIQTAADIRVDEVAEYYSHDRPSGESCFTVFEDLGDSYNHVAENIAAGYPTPSAVYTGWKNSSGHYSNMTGSDFVHYGGGFTPSGDGYNTSWVQLFSYSASCSLSNARVSAADTTLELGDSIDSLNGIFTVTCSKHGTCCMPVIEELCTGFDSNTPGLQTITVSAYGKSATFTVTVIDNTVPTRGVTLSSSTLQLTVGDTHTLAATVSPFNATNKNVMWSSSNSSVAAVNSFGVVTAKAAGTAIITATTEDGAMTASCKVTVTTRHYTLSFNTGGGTAIESVTGVEGSTISLSAITPSKNGSVFTGWYSDPSCSTRITSFTFMQNATIYAGWTSEVGQSSFADVTTNDYFYNSVQWAAKNNITKGTDATHFSPNALVTRAQVVTFLWRAASCPEPRGGAGKFTDVTAGSYYEKAVVWAIEHGITKGTSSTTFSPDMVCTRGQVVTFLARFAGVKDEKIASSFTDVESTAYYAAAVKWAKDNKVTEGTSATTFSPNQNCTRAQVVTFLYRWIVK